MRLTVVTLFLLLGFGSAHPTILYFNDAHELAPLEDGARGGLARVATLIDATRRENPETLVVFGGDLAGGTLFGTFRGAPIVEAFNKMGVDVANFGQHEFDFGAAVARQRVRESEFRWFSSNLTERDGHPFAGVPKTLLVERGGLKLGFIGLTTALKTSGAGGAVIQREPLAAARQAAKTLAAQGAQKLILVAQQTLQEDLELAAALPEIDLILSEEDSETVTTMSALGATSIAKSAGNVTSVVRADLYPGRTALSALAVDASVPEDREIAALSARYMQQLDSRLAGRVGYADVALDASAAANRTGGTVLGNLIADSFRAAQGADAALLNGGGIRSDRRYPAGDLTLRELHEILPFGDRVVLLAVEGKVLRAALEHGVANVAELDGRFPQVSGISYHFETSRPVGHRITRLRLHGKAVDPEATYTLATRAYLAAGGDGYTVLTSAELLVPAADGVAEVDALSAYLKKRPRFDTTVRAVAD